MSIVNAVAFVLLNKLIDFNIVSGTSFHHFETIYLQHIGYHLAQMEFVNWLTTFCIGSFLVGGIGYQFLRISRSRDGSDVPRGLYIQNILNVFLWLSLIGFIGVLACYVADRAHWLDLTNCDENSICTVHGVRLTPLTVYLVSATRVVPFLLPIFISSLRVGLNVIADVLLYILPVGFPFSIQREARCRLKLLLDELKDRENISVLAHSQGTVIARDVIESTNVTQFVTAGSPLGSLYGRFLGWPVAALGRCRWVNMYRNSDYIAGPLKRENIEDQIIKTDYRFNHIHYFDHADMILYAEYLKQPKPGAIASSQKNGPMPPQPPR
jgi:hypothetical protein